MSRTDRFAWRLASAVTRRPWRVIGLAVLAIAVAATGVLNLEFSNNYRVFFSPDNPDLVTFENFQATYTKNDNIVFVVHPENGEVFSPEIREEQNCISPGFMSR